MVTDYASLVEAIASHTNRDDLGDDVARFVQMAEALMKRRLRTLDNLTITELTTETANLTLPDDCLAVKQVKVDGEEVQPKYDFSPVTCLTTYERRGDMLVFDPAPTEEVTVELTYQARFLSLADGANWIIENHPDVYLYGTLAQAYAWLKDPEAGNYAGLFAGMLDDLQTTRIRDKYGSAPLVPHGITQVYGARI